MLPLLRKPKASSECFDAFLHNISGNGYIEAGELDDFLAALYKETSKQVQIMSRSYISSLLLHYVINNYCLKSRWIVAKYLPSRESGEVNIPKATIHRDWKE